MKYAHDSILKRALPSKPTENTECIDLHFQFPKFRLVRCFTLSTQVYVQVAKWKSYWLIEMNIRKTLQASAFNFIVLNLVEKAVLHFLLIMLDYIKSTLWKKQLITSKAEHLKGNCGNTKIISFQFHCGKFIQQTCSTLSYYYYRCVTRGRRREISPVLSRKLEKSSLILGKSALIVAIYWLNFLFKMHFLSFYMRKNPEFFPGGPVFLVL